MALLAPSALAVRFRSLSAAERYALLEDIWRARGYERCERRAVDGVLVAADETRTRRIAVAGALTRSIPDDVDLVVGTRDHDRIRRLAASADARVYTPRDLRDLLAYGLPRDRGEELSRVHLGTSLTVPDPEPRPMLPVSTHVILVVAALLLAPLLALAAPGIPAAIPFVGEAADAEGTVPEPVAGPGDDSSDPASGGSGPASDDPASDDPDTDDDSVALDEVELGETGHSPYPPGTDADGVDDAAQLIGTHRALTADTERAYWLEYDGPAGAAFGDRTSLRMDAWIHDADRFLVDGESVWDPNATGDGAEPPKTGTLLETLDGSEGGENGSGVAESYWADGERLHTRMADGDSERISNTSIEATPVALRLEEHAHDLLYHTLRSAETETERDDWRGWRLVQVSGSAERVEVGEETYGNVTLTSTFTSDGELVGFRLESGDESTGDSMRVTFQYHPDDDVPPPNPPDWYGSAD